MRPHQHQDKPEPEKKEDTPETKHHDMIAKTIGVDLLKALIDEFNLLQEPWCALPKIEQNVVIDRLRCRIKDNVKLAVRLIDSAWTCHY